LVYIENAMKYCCHACKRALSFDTKMSRRDSCPFCRADLHCCLNCKFHDRTAAKQCREPVAELVKEKSRANYCDYFAFAEAAAGSDAAAEMSRKELDDLFKR
jgi:hypothetical protein